MKRILTFFMGLSAFVSVGFAQDTVASFPGGLAAQNDFIAKTLVYPAASIEMGAEGTVVVVFLVKTDGSLTDMKIKRRIDPDLEKEALRIVGKMPLWTPATKDGKSVDSTVELPIRFRLK